MRLGIALDKELFKSGGILAERSWQGGGIEISVRLAAYSCSDTEAMVVGVPSVSIGQHSWNVPAAIDLDAFQQDLLEARAYAAKLADYVETQISEAIAKRAYWQNS